MSGQGVLILLDCDFKRCGNRTQLLALALELAGLADKSDDPLQSLEDNGYSSYDRPGFHRVEDEGLGKEHLRHITLFPLERIS